MCGVKGENLSCYRNKTESVSLRNCPYDPWLTSKAYSSAITVTDISLSFTCKMASKISWHRCGTKLRHCHALYTVIDRVFVCVCQENNHGEFMRQARTLQIDHTLGPIVDLIAFLTPPHRWTTLYHGCARSLASGRFHTRVLPPGTLCPTTSAPWLILSSSENCWDHTISVIDVKNVQIKI